MQQGLPFLSTKHKASYGYDRVTGSILGKTLFFISWGILGGFNVRIFQTLFINFKFLWAPSTYQVKFEGSHFNTQETLQDKWDIPIVLHNSTRAKPQTTTALFHPIWWERHFQGKFRYDKCKKKIWYNEREQSRHCISMIKVAVGAIICERVGVWFLQHPL